MSHIQNTALEVAIAAVHPLSHLDNTRLKQSLRLVSIHLQFNAWLQKHFERLLEGEGPGTLPVSRLARPTCMHLIFTFLARG